MSDTIREDYKLPSLGKVYPKQFDPNVQLRSMTVEDEMKRLSPTNRPYKMMSEIIDSCLVDKLPYSSYDLCLGDYIYLLHKLRTVTYGAIYSLSYVCPICGSVENIDINLDELEVKTYNKKINDHMFVDLPVTKHRVGLRLQTPRDLDDIQINAKEMKEKFPDMKGEVYLLTLQSFIDTIDGKPVDPIMIQENIKKLPMGDTNILSQAATKLNESIGIDNSVKVKCTNCNSDITIPFRYTDEFFRPTVY